MRYSSPGPTERSGFHRQIEKILDEMGISYISEKKFMPYTVDMYLSEWHIAIEADGPMHDKFKDRKRDAFILEEYGVPVLRIKQKPWIGKEAVIQEVTHFIESFSNNVNSRKELAR